MANHEPEAVPGQLQPPARRFACHLHRGAGSGSSSWDWQVLSWNLVVEPWCSHAGMDLGISGRGSHACRRTGLALPLAAAWLTGRSGQSSVGSCLEEAGKMTECPSSHCRGGRESVMRVRLPSASAGLQLMASLAFFATPSSCSTPGMSHMNPSRTCMHLFWFRRFI